MAVGKTIKCPNCDYQYNFQRWEKCKICQKDLPEDQLVIVFLDIERARGSGSSDPIQFGLVRYCFQRRQVPQKEEINIWTDEDIESSKFSHKISKRNGRLYKSGKKLEHVSQEEAVLKFENFLQVFDLS